MLEWPVVDSVQFARTMGKLSGSASIASLTRLAEEVFDKDGEFHVQIEGFQSRNSRLCLRLRVEGIVRLACQRCLEAVSFKVLSDRSFVLLKRNEELADIGEEVEDVEGMESLISDAELDTLAFAEDEILLQLPMAPKHDRNTCAPPKWPGQDSNGGNAFSALGALAETIKD